MNGLRITKERLSIEDLVLDATYEGGRAGNAADDPLVSLVGVSAGGGFRYLGSKEAPKLIVIYSSLADPNWPDSVDYENGVVTYYGDNNKPGRSLHSAPRFGNELLRQLFELAHGSVADREKVPPILFFTRAGGWRDVVFRGLLVPGVEGIAPTDDLVALWKESERRRYLNYRANFTILDVERIPRQWLHDVAGGTPLSATCPRPWRTWVEAKRYLALRAPPVLAYRTPEAQLPQRREETDLLNKLYANFKEDPFAFEGCAVEIARMMMPNITSCDLTRRHRDGGRDAVGKLRLGDSGTGILVEFALEAKCYSSNKSVNVRELSRLISRLRFRQFGVLVTTSYLGRQAYREIVEDEHPILVVAGGNIVRVLRNAGIATEAALESGSVPSRKSRKVLSLKRQGTNGRCGGAQCHTGLLISRRVLARFREVAASYRVRRLTINSCIGRITQMLGIMQPCYFSSHRFAKVS